MNGLFLYTIKRLQSKGRRPLLQHTDRHKNVFINYGDAYKLENNFTKALIHTLSFLPISAQLDLLADWLDEPALSQLDLPPYYIRYALQRKPTHFDIQQVPPENRRQLGLCPSGTVWSGGLLGVGTLSPLFEEGVLQVYQSLYGATPEEFEEKKIPGKRRREQRERAELEYNVGIDRTGKGSIPDAWIIIEEEGEPMWCIIIENKWFDLNPHQLRNHREKALALPDARTEIRSLSYLYDSFRNPNYSESSLVPDFLEYLSLVGQEPVHRFYPTDWEAIQLAPREDKDLYVRLFQEKFFRFFEEFAQEEGYEYGKYRENYRITVPGVSDLNLTFDFKAENAELDIATEVGVADDKINRRLFPRFLEPHDPTVSMIQELYQGSRYQRFIRLNSRSFNEYYYVEEYLALQEYVEVIRGVPLTKSKQGKQETLDYLLQQGVLPDNPDYKKMERYGYKHYHLLEYFRIVDRLNMTNYLQEPNHYRLKADLKAFIERHISGLRLLNNEYKRK